ncbi:hypothetical protein AAY473_039706, partial [Plecturocebus cupreus]
MKPPSFAPFVRSPERRALSEYMFPFLSLIYQPNKRLGSFSTNPTAYTKEFCYLTQAYDLTWQDAYIILSSALTPDERDHILTAARVHADQVHLTDNQMTV